MKATEWDSNTSADVAVGVVTHGERRVLLAAQLLQYRTRPDTRLQAASCHNRQELQHTAEPGVDFAVLSPLLPTQSHPGAPTLGREQFAELCLDMPMPVFALGDMRLDLLETAQTHSAHGVSLLSGIWLPTGTD